MFRKVGEGFAIVEEKHIRCEERGEKVESLIEH